MGALARARRYEAAGARVKRHYSRLNPISVSSFLGGGCPGAGEEVRGCGGAGLTRHYSRLNPIPVSSFLGGGRPGAGEEVRGCGGTGLTRHYSRMNSSPVSSFTGGGRPGAGEEVRGCRGAAAGPQRDPSGALLYERKARSASSVCRGSGGRDRGRRSAPFAGALGDDGVA